MTIVVAYLPGPVGLAALDAGITEARRRGTNLVVVNATKGESYVDDHLARASDVAVLDRRLADAGVPHEIRQPMGDDIADLVLQEAQASGADLVVVGLRRRSAVGKLIMGSVSQRILLEASVPVLAVHADDD